MLNKDDHNTEMKQMWLTDTQVSFRSHISIKPIHTDLRPQICSIAFLLVLLLLSVHCCVYC